MIEQKLQDEINIAMTTARNASFEFVTVEHLLLALTNILIPIKAHKALFYNPIFIYD